MPRGTSVVLIIIAALVLGFILARCIGVTIPGGSGEIETVRQLAGLLKPAVHAFAPA